MIEIIHAKSDNNGRVKVHIYKKEYDVTDKIKNGEANLNLYGKNYKVRISDGKDENGIPETRRTKKARK